MNVGELLIYTIGEFLTLIGEMLTCRPYMRPFGQTHLARSTNV